MKDKTISRIHKKNKPIRRTTEDIKRENERELAIEKMKTAYLKDNNLAHLLYRYIKHLGGTICVNEIFVNHVNNIIRFDNKNYKRITKEDIFDKLNEIVITGCITYDFEKNNYKIIK